MLLWKAAAKRIIAQEKIAEAASLGASKEYIKGLLDMAWELGLLSKKELEQITKEQNRKEQKRGLKNPLFLCPFGTSRTEAAGAEKIKAISTHPKTEKAAYSERQRPYN